MNPTEDHWARLRAQRRWAELWADVAVNGTDADAMAILRDVAATGELRDDPDGRRAAGEAFKATTRGQELHRRNVEAARARVDATR